MADPPAAAPHNPDPRAPRAGIVGRALARYNAIPLYLRILAGLVLGVAVGLVLLALKDSHPYGVARASYWLSKIGQLFLQFLGALAPPLILFAVVRSLMTADIRGRQAGYMMRLLALNTLVAICIGLLVANVVRPGSGASLAKDKPDPRGQVDFIEELLRNVPSSLVAPFVENKVIGVVIIALVFGIAARGLTGRLRGLANDGVELGFGLIITVLHWVIALVPLAVFGKVASIIGDKGFAPFVDLGWFVLAVLLALALQATYYLLRVRAGTWVRPVHLLRGTRDALVMAFSTASSTATMPVTYELLKTRVRLRDRSASLGALVGSNFNNDGTALYEAMAALFIAQMLGIELSFTQQVIVVLTSVVASVGAAGIPEAGLVTMTLVFTAVKLPVDYIPLLITVDWFLDRCRTMINVMGDMNVACMLDGKVPEAQDIPREAGPVDAAAGAAVDTTAVSAAHPARRSNGDPW